MRWTYIFVFDPEPEGGYTVTCPALPGLVTYGETVDEARAMARDAMDGLIEVMLERGETVPQGDAPEAVMRFSACRRYFETKAKQSRSTKPNRMRPVAEQAPSRRAYRHLIARSACSMRHSSSLSDLGQRQS